MVAGLVLFNFVVGAFNIWGGIETDSVVSYVCGGFFFGTAFSIISREVMERFL